MPPLAPVGAVVGGADGGVGAGIDVPPVDAARVTCASATRLSSRIGTNMTTGRKGRSLKHASLRRPAGLADGLATFASRGLPRDSPQTTWVPRSEALAPD